MTDQECRWAALMRAATRGDTSAYHRLLSELAPVLRGLASRGFARYRPSPDDVEDVLQETLLALHLKRHTWDEEKPLLPWVNAIARHKVIDSLRRRGGQVHLPIDQFGDTLSAEPRPANTDGIDAKRILATLEGRQRDIVTAISIEGASAREVARRFGMTEGTVRVTLHRALKSLAKAFRTSPP